MARSFFIRASFSCYSVQVDLVVGDLYAGMGHVKKNASMKRKEKRKQSETMRPDDTILGRGGNCYVTGPVHLLSLCLSLSTE